MGQYKIIEQTGEMDPISQFLQRKLHCKQISIYLRMQK